MSKRKKIVNNRKKRKAKKRQKVKKTKKIDRLFVFGVGALMVLFFLFLKFSYKGNITESELITIKGKLNSDLIQKSTGGTKKTYYWVFSIKNQPIEFSIGGSTKWSFDSNSFKRLESKKSDITVKVDKKTYEKADTKIGIKYLATNNKKYFDLNDYNKNKETDMRFSYFFLILGIGALIYGFKMKI